MEGSFWQQCGRAWKGGGEDILGGGATEEVSIKRPECRRPSEKREVHPRAGSKESRGQRAVTKTQ